MTDKSKKPAAKKEKTPTKSKKATMEDTPPATKGAEAGATSKSPPADASQVSGKKMRKQLENFSVC